MKKINGEYAHNLHHNGDSFGVVTLSDLFDRNGAINGAETLCACITRNVSLLDGHISYNGLVSLARVNYRSHVSHTWEWKTDNYNGAQSARELWRATWRAYRRARHSKFNMTRVK